MKNFLALVITICAIISVTDSFAAVDKKELVLTLETMSSPSAYKAFKKASSDVQYENLKSLLSQVEEAYQTCSTEVDFEKLMVSMEIIDVLKSKAKDSHLYIEEHYAIIRAQILESIRSFEDCDKSAAKAEK